MLQEYVYNNCERGACQCGNCIDAPELPSEKQPNGHTSDLIFFKVKNTNGTTKEEFEKIAKREYPHWFDGKEHNYLEIGGDVGDQGLALMTMGLGELLGVWTLFTPNLLPISEELKKQMAGMGMISIQVA